MLILGYGSKEITVCNVFINDIEVFVVGNGGNLQYNNHVTIPIPVSATDVIRYVNSKPLRCRLYRYQ